MLAALSSDTKVYEQRKPITSQFYKCVEDHFELLENIWEDCYQSLYGYFRPNVMKVIYKYLDCGDLHKGFARVKCSEDVYKRQMLCVLYLHIPDTSIVNGRPGLLGQMTS